MILPGSFVSCPPLLPTLLSFASLGALGLERSLGYVSAIESSLEQFIHSFSRCLSSAHKVPSSVLGGWNKGGAKQTWSQLSQSSRPRGTEMDIHGTITQIIIKLQTEVSAVGRRGIGFSESV